MRFLDLRHPFFLSLTVRVLTVAVAGGWAAIELLTGSPGWAVLFASVAAYCVYHFFIVFDPENYKNHTK
jgi:hypothetical protein